MAARTINILGDTQKERWLNAIGIYETAIVANVQDARNDITQFVVDDESDWDFTSLDAARRITVDFADEMRRFVEGVYNG